jgi:hypothetical protein
VTSRNAAARPLLRWARSLGCEVTRTRKQHWQVVYEGRVICVVSGTPSRPSSMKNAKAQISRGVNKLTEKEA